VSLICFTSYGMASSSTTAPSETGFDWRGRGIRAFQFKERVTYRSCTWRPAMTATHPTVENALRSKRRQSGRSYRGRVGSHCREASSSNARSLYGYQRACFQRTSISPAPVIARYELCAVVEAMYSLEQALAISGDPVLADRIEAHRLQRLAATLRTYVAHQYDQQPNQIQCSCRKTLGQQCDDANLFGLEPNYGCCTANYIKAGQAHGELVDGIGRGAASRHALCRAKWPRECRMCRFGTEKRVILFATTCGIT